MHYSPILQDAANEVDAMHHAISALASDLNHCPPPDSDLPRLMHYLGRAQHYLEAALIMIASMQSLHGGNYQQTLQMYQNHIAKSNHPLKHQLHQITQRILNPTAHKEN
jgi:hypothetical protein